MRYDCSITGHFLCWVHNRRFGMQRIGKYKLSGGVVVRDFASPAEDRQIDPDRCMQMLKFKTVSTWQVIG